LSGRYASLEASAREQAQAATEKLQLLDQAEQRLREAFQNLANRILDDKASACANRARCSSAACLIR